MASVNAVESMDEDFTGFDEEPLVVNPSATILQHERTEDGNNETDSDSGNLVIAEPNKKPESKSIEKSPRKRKSRVEDITPTRTPSSRVRGQGLAYLIAMEKGGSKKQLAKVQAQSDPLETASSSQPTEIQQPAQPDLSVELDTDKKRVGKEAKENSKPLKEKESVKTPKDKEISNTATLSDHPTPVIKPVKTTARKSYSAVNISSPLLKEPFKEGNLLCPLL